MLDLHGDADLRRATTALGVATGLFGLLPAVAPRAFARLFGIPTAGGPGALAAIRSVGLRDAVMGAGLTSAAMHGGRYAPLLLSRLLVDAGDAAVVAITLASGARNRSLATLGLLALGAAGVDFVLWRAAKQAAQSDEDELDEL